MRFSETLIGWIMRCITSVKYKVLMNGQPRGNIVPERGIHQGDPLSPFIFILCTEALVILLNHAENREDSRVSRYIRVPLGIPFYLLMIAFSS